MQNLDDLSRALHLKEEELHIIREIDAIRDTEQAPERMFEAIARLLAETLRAEFCLIFLTESEPGKAVEKARFDPANVFSIYEHLLGRPLIKAFLELDQLTVYDMANPEPSGLPSGWPAEVRLVVVPIILKNESKLGMLLLGKKEEFSAEAIQVLKTAEDQIDSAVIQGAMSLRHQESVKSIALQQRVLQLINKIDEIRDATSEPTTIYASIVCLLADHFEVDLTVLFMKLSEGDDLELKAVNDRMKKFGELRPVITHALAKHSLETSQVKIWSSSGSANTARLEALPEGMQLVTVPVILGNDRRLGVIMLARGNRSFSQDELFVLKVAEDHIDSALVQAEFTMRHQQTLSEIEAIYQIDHLRDQNISLDDLLSRVVDFLISKINVEMGFIMLFDLAGEKLELRATSHQDLFYSWRNSGAFDQAIQEALKQGGLICKNNQEGSIDSVICMPLILNEQIIGVLGVVNRLGRSGFSSFDCRLLQATGSQIDTAIYERQEIRMLRQVLGRSVDPRVMERLLTNASVDVLKPERLELTVLFADIRGSTALAEHTEPDLLVEFIKDFLMQMTEVVFSFEGTVDKFVGDEVVALFGAPIPQSDHALRGVRVGMAMQEKHRQIMETWRGRGVKAPPIGVGIVTGRMIIGEMGGAARSNYTVIGREVNLGSRICGAAEGGQVLISEATYEQVKEFITAVPLLAQRYKGVDRDVTVYDVLRLNG